MKKPNFTDNERFRLPYEDSKATSEPGYLQARFDKLRKLQAEEAKRRADIEAERQQKLRQLRKA